MLKVNSYKDLMHVQWAVQFPLNTGLTMITNLWINAINIVVAPYHAIILYHNYKETLHGTMLYKPFQSQSQSNHFLRNASLKIQYSELSKPKSKEPRHGLQSATRHVHWVMLLKHHPNRGSPSTRKREVVLTVLILVCLTRTKT